MKSLWALAAFAILLLAGCSSDEKAAETVATEAEQQQPADTSTASEVDEVAVTGDERPQAVEESGGEADPAESENRPIILAQSATPIPGQPWKFKEGKQFIRLVPTQPTLGGADKIEVAEFFWYGCHHCNEFETYINQWEPSLPANVRFVRIPATWNSLVKLHAQLYYTEEVLVKNGKIKNPEAFRAGVFGEYHRRGNRLTSMTAIQELFTKAGVSGDDFTNTWGSFEVSQKLRVAQDLARRYAISGVPAMVVNGKYRSGKSETGTYPKLLEVIDELIARESVR